MTERKEKPMTITDADIERAINKNLVKLNLTPDADVSIDFDSEDGGDVTVNGLID
jgi:hypothetical protein